MRDAVVFQYLMDKKKDDVWLCRKAHTVMKTEHSSLYVWIQHEKNGQYDELQKDETYAVCGGGFPIFVGDELIGSICVSGLPHEEDHLLIVESLAEYLKQKKIVEYR